LGTAPYQGIKILSIFPPPSGHASSILQKEVAGSSKTLVEFLFFDMVVYPEVDTLKERKSHADTEELIT
jgi:hypothetical protein